ncbi:MAG TPA: carotenoid oxygenase family protein [Thermoanaerobaculia bacterium]|nr:carotenoid oxygenase family protein [Thermoanaerobaculia bacterium]
MSGVETATPVEPGAAAAGATVAAEVAGATNATAAVPIQDHAPGLERLFSFVPGERSYEVRDVRGKLPDWLCGTCYWNGPGRFQRGEQRYRHWLDGDGMVTALRFDGDGRVHLANRFVRSAKWTAEEAAGRALFRTFGTTFAGDRLARGIGLESPVNVSVVPFAGTLLACGEQGLPWELDPVTLETRRPFTFGGALNAVSPFAAHAKVDAATGEVYNFGLSYARDRPSLHLYHFDAAGGLLTRRRVPLERPVSMHDFCLAPRHAVFHVGPYHLDLQAVTAAGHSLLDALRWEPEVGSELLIVPLQADGDPEVVRVPLGRGYCLHGIGAGEDAAGRLVVDLLELDRPVYDQYLDLPRMFPTVGPGRPLRLIVDLARRRVVERQALAYEQAPDFPVTVPRRGPRAPDDAWMLGIAAAGRPGSKFYDQLVHCDWRRGHGGAPAIWQAPRGQYLTGEPALAPHPALAAGAVGAVDAASSRSPAGIALICPLYDAVRHESRFLVFDARQIAAGPCAEVHLEAPLPTAFHAAFAPAVPVGAGPNVIPETH